MFRKTWTRITALVVVGALVLAGAGYAGAALAGGAFASGATTQTTVPGQTAQSPTSSQLHSAILDMLKDHMGITGTQAEQLADQMIARMRSLGVNGNLQTMLGWCFRYWDESRAPSGGTGSHYGYGMMDGVGSGGMMGSWGR